MRNSGTPAFVPNYVARSLYDINFVELKLAGVRFVAFDVDSTLLEYRGKILNRDTIDFFARNRQFFDGACIASNRITRDLEPIAKSLKLGRIQAQGLVRKPQKAFFRRVIRHFDAPPHEIAMIGDKLIADMYGAKRSGLVTIWVERMGERDSLWDRILQLRRFERRLMEKYLKDLDVT